MVQCGGTLACFLGGVSAADPASSDFCFSSGGWEGIGNAFILQGSLESVSPMVRRDCCVVLEALGGMHQEHQEHPRGALARPRRRLEDSLISGDL